MSDEVQLETDVETRVERSVEVEESIRDALETESTSAEQEVNIDLTSGRLISPSIRTGRVVGVNQESSDTLILHVAVDGDELSYSLPWPSDPTDRREPVVRLARWNGISVDRIANLETVPLMEYNSSYDLHVPPGKRRRQLNITLPGGIELHPTYVSLKSRYRGFIYRLTRVCLYTTAADTNARFSHRGHADLNTRFFVALFFIPACLASMAGAFPSGIETFPQAFLLLFLFIMMTVGPIYGALLDDVGSKTGDRYSPTGE